MDVGVVVSDVLWIVCGVDDVHWMCVLFCVCLSTLLLLNADPQDAVLVTFFFFCAERAVPEESFAKELKFKVGI